MDGSVKCACMCVILLEVVRVVELNTFVVDHVFSFWNTIVYLDKLETSEAEPNDYSYELIINGLWARIPHNFWWLVEYLIDRNGVDSWLFWDIFSCKVKNIIFAWKGACEMRLNPHKVRLNIEMKIPAGGAWARWGEGLWSGGQSWGAVSGIPFPYLVSHLPYLVSHLPIWYPISPIWYPISPIWYWYPISLSGIPSH